MPSTVWGPLISPLDVEAAIRLVLQTWIDSALTEIERRRGDLLVRELPRPVAWHAVNDLDDVDSWPDRDLPAVVIEPSDDTPSLSNQGLIDEQLAFTVTILHRPRGKRVDREHDRAVTVHLVTAVKWVLWKNGSLGGLASGVFCGRTVYDFAPPARAWTLSGAQIDVIAHVPATMRRRGLPDAPDAPPPTSPPDGSPEHAAHTETNVHVDVVTELP